MADQKISAMPNAAALTGAELVPLVQGGANVKTTLTAIKAAGRTYGAFSDTTSQAGSITAGTALTFNVVDVVDGITLANDSQITVPNTGIYNLQFSMQLKNVDNAQHEATIWFRVNGVDVPNSATSVTVPARKTSNIYGYLAPAWNIYLNMTAGQYAEIVWLPSSTQVTVETQPASLSPAHPAIPSIIATMNQVG